MLNHKNNELVLKIKVRFYAFSVKHKENDVHRKYMLLGRLSMKHNYPFIFTVRSKYTISLHLALLLGYKEYVVLNIITFGDLNIF